MGKRTERLPTGAMSHATRGERPVAREREGGRERDSMDGQETAVLEERARGILMIPFWRC